MLPAMMNHRKTLLGFKASRVVKVDWLNVLEQNTESLTSKLFIVATSQTRFVF